MSSDSERGSVPVTVALWSAKGGSGVTTAAALYALRGARQTCNSGRALLVDGGGDLPGALGVPEPAKPGLAEWLAVGDEVGADAAVRLCSPVAVDLDLLPRGLGPLSDAARAGTLARALAGSWSEIVMDLGCLSRPGGEAPQRRGGDVWGDDLDVRRALAGAADHSILVTRACFLSLRRAVRVVSEVPVTGVFLLQESGRPLTTRDVEEVVGAPVINEIPMEPAVARCVDAGLVATRVPAVVDRRMRAVAERVALGESPPSVRTPSAGDISLG